MLAMSRMLPWLKHTFHPPAELVESEARLSWITWWSPFKEPASYFRVRVCIGKQFSAWPSKQCPHSMSKVSLDAARILNEANAGGRMAMSFRGPVLLLPPNMTDTHKGPTVIYLFTAGQLAMSASKQSQSMDSAKCSCKCTKACLADGTNATRRCSCCHEEG